MPIMSERVEMYRGKATECRWRAQSAAELGIRLNYLELANQWKQLAQAIECKEAAN